MFERWIRVYLPFFVQELCQKQKKIQTKKDKMNENGEAVSAIKTQISRFQATTRPKLPKIDILTNKCYSTFVKYIQKKRN